MPAQPSTSAAATAAAPQGPSLDDIISTLNNMNMRMEQNNNKSLVADPGMFKGTKKEFEPWWRKMRLYLKGNKAKINTNDRKVMVVLSRLGGKMCASFAEGKIDKGIAANTFGSWQTLEAEITQRFTEHNTQEISKMRIENFKQGPHKVDEFMTAFKTLKERAGTDDGHAVFLLQKNMAEEILKVIYEYPTLPSGYEAWKAAILTIGRNKETF